MGTKGNGRRHPLRHCQRHRGRPTAGIVLCLGALVLAACSHVPASADGGSTSLPGAQARHAPAPGTVRSTAPATAVATTPAPATIAAPGPSPEARQEGAAVVTAPSVESTAVGLIDRARTSVDLEVYELGSTAVIDALQAAVHRGVAVSVLLDPTESQSVSSAAALRSGGVPVRTLAVPGGIDHVKLLVTDGSTGLVGGVNLGSYSSDTTDMDLEFGPSMATSATQFFATDWAAAAWAGQAASGTYGPLATGSAIEPAILSVIDGASSSCTVVANYLTDHGVEAALVAASRRGVSAQVVLNPSAYGAAAAEATMRQAGVAVETAPATPYLHAKVVSCDDGAVVGSANFSYDGMTVNHELDVVVTGPAATAVAGWAHGVWAADG